MTTRVVVLEVRDTRSEDLLHMAIQKWNAEQEVDQISHRVLYSAPVGDSSALRT